MPNIWSAASVKLYGGGVAEERFLRAHSDLIGDYSYTNGMHLRSLQPREFTVTEESATDAAGVKTVLSIVSPVLESALALLAGR
ncbi:hypothetical protein [Arthrobacter sp. UYEF3]|uniref:hypothetical protein n=1 Tax=Arthrobacter sp. UYEF3 TaxID=1756365 RepID=UPI0033983FFB